MKKIILLLAFLTLSAFSAIDERKIDVYFGNGILTEKDDSKKYARLVDESIKQKFSIDYYNQHIGKVAYAYNSTHLWGFGDPIESALQKLDVKALVDAFLLWKAAIRTSRSKKMVSGHKYNYSGSQKKQASSGANLLPEQS